MPTIPKTALMSLRMTPNAKALLAACAQRESRSMANMLELMVYDYAQARGVSTPAPEAEATAAAQNTKTPKTKKTP